MTNNHKEIAIIPGTLKMEPQGHGCFFGFCQWGDGTVTHDPTCSWPGMRCDQNTHILLPGESKEVFMDFTEALDSASGTTGCCSTDSSCGCNLRGLSTFNNARDGDYCKMYMWFQCNLNTYVCSV